MAIMIHPILRPWEDFYYVGVGEICVADKDIPLMTGSLSACSALMAFDKNQDSHLLAHVLPTGLPISILRTLTDNFNLESQSLEIIVIPGAGFNDYDSCYESPRFSLSVICQALDGLRYQIVDDWYKVEREYISIHNGIIQKHEKESFETSKELLPRSLICKPF